MERYKELCIKYSNIIDQYWGLLHETNPVYELLGEVLDELRKEKGISKEEDNYLWEEILESEKD